MTEIKYPTAFSHWDVQEQAAIARVLTTGRFTQGQEVAAFENEFAAYHGMNHAIMTNSGSSANLIMIATLFQLGQLKRGDKVLVPAIAWSTTYAPLIQHGLDLLLLDCDSTWNANPEVPGRDWEDAKLVVGCSILGNPSDLISWKTIAGVLDAVFIEDNCESLGALVKGTNLSSNDLCGTRGLMNSFSFFYSHQISAIEGGMILTNDEDCANTCRMLRAHGWTRDITPPTKFDDEYRFESFGYNVRGLELHAAIAREQLKKLPEFIKQRNNNLVRFRKWTDHFPIVHQTLNGSPSPFGLSFLVESGEKRAALVAALRTAEIDCRLPTGGSFRLHPYGKEWRDQETPNADKVHQTGLFLGNAPFDIGNKIARAVEVMGEIL